MFEYIANTKGILSQPRYRVVKAGETVTSPVEINAKWLTLKDKYVKPGEKKLPWGEPKEPEGLTLPKIEDPAYDMQIAGMKRLHGDAPVENTSQVEKVVQGIKDLGDDGLTKDGVPNAFKLKNHLGFNVSRELRDEAFELTKTNEATGDVDVLG